MNEAVYRYEVGWWYVGVRATETFITENVDFILNVFWLNEIGSVVLNMLENMDDRGRKASKKSYNSRSKKGQGREQI